MQINFETTTKKQIIAMYEGYQAGKRFLNGPLSMRRPRAPRRYGRVLRRYWGIGLYSFVRSQTKESNRAVRAGLQVGVPAK
jgi:hypothetical protein